MGDFIYYDIFAAKGMDYLIAIICVLLLIVFWKWLQKPEDAREGSSGWKSSVISLAVVVAALVIVSAVYHICSTSGAASKTINAGLCPPPVYGFDLSTVPDGTFHGETHFGSFVCGVDVTVKNHIITAVEIVSSENGQNSPEEIEITRTVLDEQTPYVCTVSGATISTRAFLRAVENALLGAL